MENANIQMRLFGVIFKHCERVVYPFLSILIIVQVYGFFQINKRAYKRSLR